MRKEITVREAKSDDLDDLAEISRSTWDGHDYLEQVSGNWLKESGFYVGEIAGKVIGCGKITTLPGEVAWLEGLRVHKDYKGRGLGRILSDELLRIATMKKESGEFKNIEFSTYINNIESISMAEKQGFTVLEIFHVVNLENPPILTPVVLKKCTPSPSDFSIYPLHSPCGWKYILHCSEGSIDWMLQNAEFWEVDSGAKFLTANRGSEVSPLTPALDDPEGFMQGVFAIADRKRLDCVELMIHDSHKTILNKADKAGFTYWEEEGKANLPVYRFLK